MNAGPFFCRGGRAVKVGCVIGGFGAFIVVANTYNDFARAIRRKLILEIAGRVPEEDKSRVVLAASGVHPPCDVGEIIRDSRESF